MRLATEQSNVILSFREHFENLQIFSDWGYFGSNQILKILLK